MNVFTNLRDLDRNKNSFISNVQPSHKPKNLIYVKYFRIENTLLWEIVFNDYLREFLNVVENDPCCGNTEYRM